MNNSKISRGVYGSSILILALAGSTAQASLITIPHSALSSSPGVYTSGGYYTNDLGPNIVSTGGGNAANVGRADGRNDDGYQALNLGFDVSFFGSTYNSLYVNNNGNVSFNSGISAFIPSGPTGANAPIISPFFSDVDTRSPDSGVVHYNLSSDQLVVTWDNVGWYSSHGTPTDSFQLVLRGDDYSVPNGEGAIGFFYEGMGWDATDTNQVSAAGFGDGSGNGEVIEGSLDTNLNTALNNKYLWFDADLAPVTPTNPPGNGGGGNGNDVPEPGSFAILLLGLIGVGASARRRRA